MKLSVVAEGGGMRGAYVLGVMDALQAHYGITPNDFDALLGVSASAGTLANFSSGELYKGYEIWSKQLASKKFISFSNILSGRPYMDVDYVVDTVFKQLVPLSTENVVASPSKVIVPLLRVGTGEVVFFDLREHPSDIFEILRAAMSAPIAYNKTVLIEGVEYADAHFSTPLPLDCKHLNNTRRIIILTKPIEYAPSGLGVAAKSVYAKFFCPSTVYHSLQRENETRNRAMHRVEESRESGDIILAPKYMPKTLDNSSATVLSFVKQGYTDAVESGELADLMSRYKHSKE